MLETLITSKTRIRILVKFFINAANNGHLRGLAEEMNESTNAIRKELNNLSEAGYLEKKANQNRVSYKANIHHPLFKTLQKIVFQHLGLDAIIDMILDRMGAVQQIVVLGDYANGIDSGVIEVLIIGQELNENYIEQLAIKIEAEIKRKVIFKLQKELSTTGLLIFEAYELINKPKL
ncbi:ArsR family transcriptional regulator [Flavobacterium sp. SUN052]|uniref:ArsR family transcriptional regulator n=1 Tax=Flavobacterium sp. SUN052 TaxID=3002441 RepID=UPI00237E3364|nr:ArsR family transcriptional regulator [Flavobacterium sp. SUN052]MEC4004438.1 ArsR family transcriptional regulator [Flavobacterium sp. SUN052]